MDGKCRRKARIRSVRLNAIPKVEKQRQYRWKECPIDESYWRILPRVISARTDETSKVKFEVGRAM